MIGLQLPIEWWSWSSQFVVQTNVRGAENIAQLNWVHNGKDIASPTPGDKKRQSGRDSLILLPPMPA